jgi:hypothetical protein
LFKVFRRFLTYVYPWWYVSVRFSYLERRLTWL